jgi:hypothetical protein
MLQNPAVLVGNAAPALVARLSRFGDGAAAPQLPAGPGVVRGNDASVGAELVFASARGKDFAVGDDGSRGLLRWSFLIVDDARLPQQFAGLGVEREQKVVGAAVYDLVAVYRKVAIDAGCAT